MAIKVLHNSDLKYTNKLSILKILQGETASRAGIAVRLNLSKSAVSGMVEELLESGWIQEVGFGKSTEQGGKKPVLLQINKRAALIAAVYFSYNLVEVAITDLTGEILVRGSMQLSIKDACRLQCKEVTKKIAELMDELRLQGVTEPLMAVGVVVKGLIDTEKGILVYSATLPGWESTPIAQYFKDELHAPCFVENDVRAVTAFQLSRYREMKPKVMMCVSAERGVGVGLSIEDHIFYGANSGISTTHMILDPNGPLCSCGNRGCWDVMASVEMMLKQIRERDGSLKDLDYQQAVQLYHENHPIVCQVVENYTGYWMALGIQNAVSCYNPDVVILVGGYFSDFPGIGQLAEKAVHTMPNIAARSASVIFAPKEEDVFLHSAACVVFSRFFSTKYHEKLSEAIK